MHGAGSTGETLTERSKGKDVRTSNIIAAKVLYGCDDDDDHLHLLMCTYSNLYSLFILHIPYTHHYVHILHLLHITSFAYHIITSYLIYEILYD